MALWTPACSSKREVPRGVLMVDGVSCAMGVGSGCCSGCGCEPQARQGPAVADGCCYRWRSSVVGSRCSMLARAQGACGRSEGGHSTVVALAGLCSSVHSTGSQLGRRPLCREQHPPAASRHSSPLHRFRSDCPMACHLPPSKLWAGRELRFGAAAFWRGSRHSWPSNAAAVCRRTGRVPRDISLAAQQRITLRVMD